MGVFEESGIAFFLEPKLIEILTAVFECAHASVSMQLSEQVQINVGNQNHFRIRSGLGTFSVCRESKVARREHTGLRILNVHIMHTRQVTHTSGNHHEALVFDGTGLSADTHTGIGILRIGGRP